MSCFDFLDSLSIGASPESVYKKLRDGHMTFVCEPKRFDFEFFSDGGCRVVKKKNKN